VELQEYVTAWEQSLRSLLALLAALSEQDWERPTELPGWSVHDVVAHLAAAERELLGDPRPGAPSSYGPHVRSDFGRHMEDGVQARRSVPPAALVEELAGALDERLPVVRAARADEPPVRVVADEDWDMTVLLRNRAFDAWMHEQDLRRAVTRPGNLDGPGALVTWELLGQALPFLVARRAGAGPGASVRVTATGAVARTATVLVDERGRGRLGDLSGGEPTAALSADWETWVRLLGGRLSPGDAVVEVSGDTALGRRLLDGCCVTP
jgi:uncharacterized protein (TIGR03083 family)